MAVPPRCVRASHGPRLAPFGSAALLNDWEDPTARRWQRGEPSLRLDVPRRVWRKSDPARRARSGEQEGQPGHRGRDGLRRGSMR